jgi:hypothetical protein
MEAAAAPSAAVRQMAGSMMATMGVRLFLVATSALQAGHPVCLAITTVARVTAGLRLKDNATGLIFSKTMGSTYAFDDTAASLTWYVANNCTESSGGICTK